MADTFEIIGVIPSTRLEAGTRIVETIEATGLTIPHGVNFTVTVDKVAGWREELGRAAALEAAELEAAFEL